MLEWRRRIAGWQALGDVDQAATRHAAAVRALDEAVRAARAAGASWADIGRATGLTGRAAAERWSTGGRVGDRPARSGRRSSGGAADRAGGRPRRRTAGAAVRR
jgi:hypothetical protein